MSKSWDQIYGGGCKYVRTFVNFGVEVYFENSIESNMFYSKRFFVFVLEEYGKKDNSTSYMWNIRSVLIKYLPNSLIILKAGNWAITATILVFLCQMNTEIGRAHV